MSRNKQEEERRRKAAAAVVPVVKKTTAPTAQNAVKQGAAYKNPMTVSTTKAVPVVKSASVSAAKPAAQQSTTLKTLPVIGAPRSSRPTGSGAQGTTVRTVTPVKQHRTDQRDLQKNMLAWHQTSDPAKRAELHAANDAIRARHGYTYRNGVTRDRQGRNLSTPVTMLTGERRGTAAQTRQAAAPEVARAEIARTAEADRQASYDRQTPLSALGHNAMSALAGINKMGYSTIDMLLPDVITPKPIQDWIDRSKANADDINERVNRYNYERGGAAGAFFGSAFQSGLQMVPQAVLAVLSGGTSETAQAAETIGNVGKSAVRKVIEAMGKNPSYWASFAQTVGNDYEDAKAGGASDTQAAVSAILSSAINAGIEVGGGLETLKDNPNTIRNWLKSASEEGAEEVKQGIVTGLAQKGVYDHDKPWLTVGSGEGVVDPVRAAQEYGAGTLVGGVVGAPRMIGGVRADARAQAQSQTQVDVQEFTAPLTETLVKIDGMMRQADALPEGEIKQQRKAQLQESAQQVSRQLSRIENNRAEFAQAKAVAERFGAKFELANLGAAGGKYENGTITVNPYAQSPVRQVLVHELTHHLETSGQYADLQRAAIAAFSTETGVDADTLRANIVTLYGRNGAALDYDGASRELTAAYCENRLFQDEDSIRRLAQTDVNLFQRIRQWIADAVVRLTGTEEQKCVLEVQRLYEKAASELGVQEGKSGAQYTFSREADTMTLMQAEQMEREGASRDDIWRALGVIRDTKGNWVSEIDDSAARIRLAGMQSTLGDTMQHDALYQHVPGLQDTGVIVEPGYMTQNGYFDPADNAIHLNRKLIGAPEQTLLHETQHRVQQAEGRPNGASADYWAGTENPGELYRNTAGEIEARETASRRSMTAEERRQKMPDLGWDRAVFAEDAGKNQSLNENFGQEFDNWLASTPEFRRMTDGGWFHVGTTSEALQSIGVDDRNIYWRKQKIGYIMSEHPEMTPAIIKQVPSLLENPIAVLRSKTRGDSIVVLGDVTADNGKKVMAAVDLTPTATGNTEANFNLLSSAYGRTDGSIRSLLTNSDVLYLDPNKKRTDTWLMSLRVQFPSGQPVYGSMGRVTYTDDGVKIQGRNIFSAQRNTFGFTPEQIARPEQQPLSDFMQYGKTPEQAGMEARARREGERAQQQRAEKQEAETQTLIDAWNTARPIRDRIKDMRSKMNLTENDERVLQGSMLTGDTNGILKNANDPTAVLQLYQLEQQAREAMEPVRKYNTERRQRMELQAAEFAESIAEYATDKKRGLAYQTETPERNIYDIFGKAHRVEAERFIGEYLTPVHKAAAEGVRLQNGYRERVKALNLDKHESAMVQMIAEGERRAAEMYASEHGIKLDEAKNAKLNRAATEFRAIYSELMQKINEVEVKNGLEPTRVRRDYMPHFVDGKPDTLIAKAFYRLGMKITGKDTIPTDLAGVTEAFRPGHQWESHLQHRTGENTVYDAVRGFDQYIDTMADYLTQTDNIQKLRALEDAVRYRLSDEGTRAKIDEIKRDYTKDALARRQAMEDAYDADNQTTAFQRAVNEVVGQRDAGMRNFVTELRRYTDQLAGKKHRGDRGIEDMVGRDIYEISRNLEGRVAANMIALNPGSWLTNFIPITQAWGEVDAKHLLRGMAETVKSYAKDDGFVDTSAFLTNRHGSESIAKTTLRKISDKAGAPMEWIDHFVSDSIVRARTMQNMEKNRMDFSAAVDEADSFAAGLMADRSKGSMPGVFEMRNPLIKTFTMFQLEVNNQLRYLAKDLPRHMEGKSTAAAMAATGAALTKIFLGAFLFNAAYSQLTGRDSALDPIGMIADALGIGDDDDKERTGWDVAESLGKSVAENLPFVGGIIGGGRVPISSALPDMGNIWNAAKGSAATNKKAQTIGKELLKPAIYLLPPFGGGAANKIINGYQTVKAGGSYSLDSDGNRVLQFPAYGQTPLDYAKAMAFGKWSSKEAQQYVDSGFGGLNAKETAAYEELHSMGVSSRDAWAAVRGLDGFETVKDEDGKVVQSKKEQQRLALFDNDTLTAAQKEALDRALIVSGEDELPADYSDRTAFLLSQYVSDNRKSAARAALNTGLSIDQFRTWDGRMTETAREKDADGKSKFSTAEAAGRVLNEIQNDSTLKDSEKQAIADYVLISAMSDSVQEKWQEVRGKVNATDFVKFRAALADINKDGGTPKNDEITAAVEAVPGLTDEQRGYLWQSAKSGSTKNNPWGAETAKAGAVNPVEGGTLSSGFGLRQSFTTSNGASSSSNHKAIDIAAPAGTAVKAAMGGKIIAVTPGYNGGYGNTVEIDCGNGIVMKYHHMQDGSISGVSVGQEVGAGEQIGKVGSTGNSTGPHLDFQVVKDGDFVDPRNYIPGYGEGTAATISAAQDTSTSGGKRGGSGSGSGGLKKLEGLKKLPVFG